jgi:hypothetical protein
MSGRTKSPDGKVFYGSVTQSVLVHSDVPVTFEPPTDSSVEPRRRLQVHRLGWPDEEFVHADVGS